jgi:hypothetical protein
MTIAMPDSVTVANLPPGYPAYLGYTDGKFNTAAELAKRFPGAELVLLTVTGETLGAHGVRVSSGADAEPGDLTAAHAVEWVQTSAALGERPVIYASTVGATGYGMPGVLQQLAARGVDRQEVRLLSAHYGDGPHICGPNSCGLIDVPMDGTQWTAAFITTTGGRNAVVDMSMLADDFFGPPQSETERLVRELGIVRQGDTGAAVERVQALCQIYLGTSGPKRDGVFGLYTKNAVTNVQHTAGFAPADQDGVVGPQTWPVLLGVA